MIKFHSSGTTGKLVIAFALVLSSFCANSQNYTPKSYYTFESATPMKDSLGFFNLDPNYYISGYTINSNPANVGVGRYMSLDSSATIIRGGTLAIDSAVTFEFLFKPGFYFGTTVFLKRMDGAVELRMSFPNINFMTNVNSTSGASVYDDFQISLDGIGRKNYGYYIDGNWHHIVFKYNAKAGTKEVWVDGQLPAGFSKTVTGGSFATSGNREYVVNSQSTYYKYQGAMDELAVYYNSLGANSIYQHYLNFTNNQHYSFANPTVTAPAAAAVTAGIDINEYAPGHPSPTITPIEQIKNFPIPRYKLGHTLYPNNPFVGYYYLSGYNTYETSYANAVNNSKTIQLDMVKNFNYLLLASENTGTYNEYSDSTRFPGAWVKLANQYPQYKSTALTYWPQINPTNIGKNSSQPYVSCQCLPNSYYLQNSSGAYLDPNGGTGSQKYISPAGPKDSLVNDGLTQKYYLQQLLNKLSRPLDYVFENGEVIPFLYYSNVMTQDPTVVADKNSTGLDWFTYEGKRVAEKIKTYRDQFMGSLTGLANTKFAYYQIDGQNQWNWKWSELRSVNTAMNGTNYATGDIYVRWPNNWRNWTSAWHGWQWVVESRHEQLASGDKYFSPAVSPGWDNNEENNVRPAQWLGFLKAVSMAGAEFFTTGYFVTSQPYQNPKGYVWQMVMPAYAQAITSRYEDLFRNGYLMGGDVPNSTSNPLYMAYSFYAGDPRKLVVIRKHNTLNKYAITGTIQPSSNMSGATENEGVAQIKLDGQTLKFKVRRQGSTYIYDNTNTASPIFYQLDQWHESTYPYYWTKDISLEAELFDNTNSNVYLKTTRPSGAVAGDFSTFTTSIGFNAVSDITYNFQPRASVNNNYYVWVLARSKNGQSTGMTILLDGANSKQIGCVADTNWVWYKYNLSNSTAISFSSVASGVDHVLTLTPTNTNLEIDKILLSTNSGVLYNSPAPCAAAATPTISASGPLAFCTGGSVTLTASTGNSYSWSTGATTQSITVSAAGNYSVAVVSTAGTGTSSPVTVTVNSSPTASITAGGSTTFCQGGNVTLTASSASSYSWTPGNQTTQAITVTASGNYSVKVTNTSGCSATSGAKTVTVNPAPAATISASGSTTFAQGGSVTLTASSAGTGGSYLWSPGNQTTQAITVTASGSYTVRVTNSSACSATSAATVVTVTTGTIVPKITGSGPTTFCQGGSVVLTCSAANSYLWNTGATTQSITVSTAGTYTCTATTSSGTGTAAPVSVVVTTPSPSTITASGSTSICQGSNVTLTANSGYTYLWSPGGQTTQAISASTAGNYTVRVTDLYGCSSTSPASTVNVNAVPTATITASGPTTFNAGGSVTLTSSSAGTGGSYLWSPGNQTTQSINATTAGSYTVRVTNNSGCSKTSSATTITVNSTTTATITVSGSTTFCQGQSAILSASKGAAYLWSTGQTSRKITVTQSGSYVVTVTAFTTGAIAVSNPQVITVNSAPTTTVSASGATTFCSGASVNLTASAASSYLWSPGGQTTQTITATTSGSYFVTVSNANGCTASSASTTVTANNCGGSCVSPGNKTTTNITGTSATLNWSYVSADNFYVQLVNMNTGAVYNTAALGNTVVSITIGVTPSTTYQWYVRSRCGTTYTAWGSYTQFTTPSARLTDDDPGFSTTNNLTPLFLSSGEETISGQGTMERSGFSQNDFSVFPNPASTYADVVINASESATSRIIVRDFTNRVIKSFNVTVSGGANKNRIDLTGIAKGTYFISVDYPEFHSSKKLVIE